MLDLLTTCTPAHSYNTPVWLDGRLRFVLFTPLLVCCRSHAQAPDDSQSSAANHLALHRRGGPQLCRRPTPSGPAMSVSGSPVAQDHFFPSSVRSQSTDLPNSRWLMASSTDAPGSLSWCSSGSSCYKRLSNISRGEEPKPVDIRGHMHCFNLLQPQ